MFTRVLIITSSEEKLRDILALPDGIRPQAVLTFGYPDEKPVTPPKYTLEDVMFFRQFGCQGNRIDDIPRYKGEFSYKLKNVLDKSKEALDKAGKLLGEKAAKAKEKIQNKIPKKEEGKKENSNNKEE